MFAQDLREPGDAGQQSINYWVKRSTAPEHRAFYLHG